MHVWYDALCQPCVECPCVYNGGSKPCAFRLTLTPTSHSTMRYNNRHFIPEAVPAQPVVTPAEARAALLARCAAIKQRIDRLEAESLLMLRLARPS